MQDPRWGLQRKQLLMVRNNLSESHNRTYKGVALRFNSGTNHFKYKLQLEIQIFQRHSHFQIEWLCLASVAVQHPRDMQTVPFQSQTKAAQKFFRRVTLLFIHMCNDSNQLALQTRHLKSKYSDFPCSLLISRTWMLYG